tara:strand:+ start:473 stop:658 length:186 start_codon:yes stop_codon:yes gene_type:complete
MRIFNKYIVGDKVMIRHLGKTCVGNIERDKGYVGSKKIIIPKLQTTLSYRYYKKNIIKRIE